MNEKIFCTYCGFKLEEDLYCSECGKTSKYLFECDSLVAEIERLKQEILQHIEWNETHTRARVELSEEIERLKQNRANGVARLFRMEETLKKCSPYYYENYADHKICWFCGSEEYSRHEDNCEYVELTKNV